MALCYPLRISNCLQLHTVPSMFKTACFLCCIQIQITTLKELENMQKIFLQLLSFILLQLLYTCFLFSPLHVKFRNTMLISHIKESYFAELWLYTMGSCLLMMGFCIRLPSIVVTYDKFLRCSYKLPNYIFLFCRMGRFLKLLRFHLLCVLTEFDRMKLTRCLTHVLSL